MTQVNGFQGLVGYSLRELNTSELAHYCSSSTRLKTVPLQNQNRSNFTYDFMIRSYTSGCYFYDTNNGKWSSYGMDLYEDTNLEYTHCYSTHLTSFAGGLVFTPSTINYQYVFANMPFTRSPTIYLAVLIAVCLYIIFAIYSLTTDVRLAKKMGIYVMKDNYQNDSYFYELIVFTGNRNESGTQSKVSL
jgi:hypothetical protein